jgi:hypothetical protein
VMGDTTMVANNVVMNDYGLGESEMFQQADLAVQIQVKERKH